jgi:hypothetical protein
MSLITSEKRERNTIYKWSTSTQISIWKTIVDSEENNSKLKLDKMARHTSHVALNLDGHASLDQQQNHCYLSVEFL